MKNLSEIMRMSNNNTLLLFDEIGSVQNRMKEKTCNIYFRRVVPCGMYYCLRVRITEKLKDSQKCTMTL